jgi:predicted RNase H-like nuclease (RuvC/YqgF family)
MYNLTVATAHTYLVGAGLWLVHNSCSPQNIEKSIHSLEQRIAEHERKLADYIANPDAFDNKGFLRNAPSEEVRQSIIQGRINHLQHKINNWRQRINELRKMK